MIPDRVEPCLETVRKISPGRPSAYSPMVAKPLQSATRNSKVFEMRVRGSFWRAGGGVALLHDPLHHLGRRIGRSQGRCVLLGRREGLTDLAVVPVDGHRLHAELP